MSRVAVPVTDRYPTAHVRGRLTGRADGRTLGWATLDAATADDLGREQIGWFVGGHPGIAAAADQFGRLDGTTGGVWVVCPSSREMAHELRSHWPHGRYVSHVSCPGESVWRSRKVWVAIPEDLRRLLPLTRDAGAAICGVVILDPTCHIYRSRGGTDSWGHSHRNDRPQHVVNFRAELALDDWHPPLILLTSRPALAVDPKPVARAFGLNGFRFIAGNSFACWDEPIIPE